MITERRIIQRITTDMTMATVREIIKKHHGSFLDGDQMAICIDIRKETRYTCMGNVRHCCQINHKTLVAAVQCLRADQKSCRKASGYSDREIQAIDIEIWPNSDRQNYRKLNDDERAEWNCLLMFPGNQ